MYFLRKVQWKGRSSGIFDKPVVFVGVQESYWPWCSAYHHQKNTACPGKKGKEKKIHKQRRSKLVFWCMSFIQNILLNVKKKIKDCEKIGLSVRFFLHSTLYWILNWQLTELEKPWRENIEFCQLLFLLYTVHTTCSFTKPHAMWYGNCTVFGWCDITHSILCQAKECLKSQPFFKFTMNYLIVGIPSNTVSIWLLKEKDIKYFKSVNKVVQMFLLTS